MAHLTKKELEYLQTELKDVCDALIAGVPVLASNPYELLGTPLKEVTSIDTNYSRSQYHIGADPDSEV